MILLLKATMYLYYKWYAKNGSPNLRVCFFKYNAHTSNGIFFVYGEPGYYRLLLIEVTMYSRTNQVKLVLLKVTM